MRALLLVALFLPQAPTPLIHYRDEARPVLVFTPSPSDPRFLDQLYQLEAHTSELAERQVVVLVFPHHPTAWKHPAASAVWPDNPLDPVRVRSIYRISLSEFTVVLLGKDGGEKLRVHTPLSYETLRQTIDAMPMRRQEMQRE